MQLVEVKDKKTAKQFLDVARIIYKDDTVWVCPLDSDINDIFNPKKIFFILMAMPSDGYCLMIMVN